MHHDIKGNDKSLKEFHLFFNCDSNNCDKIHGKKNNIDLKPGWFFSHQYRDKKTNKLIAMPLMADYEEYDEEYGIQLNPDEYRKALEKFKEDIRKTSTLELIRHFDTNKHVIVLGATGSGKTQSLIFPSMMANADLPYEVRPTIVVTDPKGEIFRSTSKYFLNQGYVVKVLNLLTPTESNSWNPLGQAWNLRRESIFFEKENVFIKTVTSLESLKKWIGEGVIEKDGLIINVNCWNHNNRTCEECIEKFMNEYIDIDYIKGEEIKIFTIKGKFVLNEYEYDQIIQTNKLELITASEKEVVDFTFVALQDPPGSSDPFWTDGARSYFAGIALTMLELMDENPQVLPLEKFNVSSIILLMDNTTMKEWYIKFLEKLDEKGKKSFAYQQIASVVNSSDQTKQSLISSAKVATSKYSYNTIKPLLCNVNNSINLENIVEGSVPHIIYLIVPDDDNSLHEFAAAFVEKLYKTGVRQANKNATLGRTKEPTLTRQIQFYLDEFGNFPKIPAMEQMITVARSRNIFFMLILQDYDQLTAVYGKEAGKNH